MPKGKRSEETAHRSKPVPVARDVGRRIRELRKKAGYNFDSWVESTGLGRGYCSELERGLVNPSLVTLTRVARCLDVPVSYLVLGESVLEQLFEAARPLKPGDLRKLIVRANELVAASAEPDRKPGT